MSCWCRGSGRGNGRGSSRCWGGCGCRCWGCSGLPFVFGGDRLASLVDVDYDAVGGSSRVFNLCDNSTLVLVGVF